MSGSATLKVLSSSGGEEMKEAKDTLRIVGFILLGLFVLVVGIPLVLTAAGIALHLIGFIFVLAVGLIKLAVILSVVYLILVGIRTMLR